MDHGFLAPANLLAHFPLASGSTVAECGVSGSGAMMSALSSAVGSSGHVLVFDVNRHALSALASQSRLRGLHNIHTVWTNLEIVGGTMSVKDHVLDAAIAVHVFHENKHHVEMLTELHRMIKPSGSLLVVDWTKESTHPLAPKQSHRLAAGYLEQVATEHGYTVTKRFSPDNDHWALILTTT